jgi:threonylcarbamoyladenosine tRNA methylthiotransferase MtaB
MPQVPRHVARERAARLRQAGAVALTRHLERRVGRMARVLTERGGTARTADFTLVRINPAIAHGQLADVAIAGHDGRALIAAP